MKDAWVASGLAGLAVEGYVLCLLVRSERFERRDGCKSCRLEVGSSEGAIRGGDAAGGALRLFASVVVVFGLSLSFQLDDALSKPLHLAELVLAVASGHRESCRDGRLGSCSSGSSSAASSRLLFSGAES